MGAEKKRLNEMVLTFFVLIYLFIYLSIYSHSCIVVLIFFIHVQVVHMLLGTFAMLKSWPYVVKREMTSHHLRSLSHPLAYNVKMYKYQYAKFDQTICVVQEL